VTSRIFCSAGNRHSLPANAGELVSVRADFGVSQDGGPDLVPTSGTSDDQDDTSARIRKGKIERLAHKTEKVKYKTSLVGLVAAACALLAGICALIRSPARAPDPVERRADLTSPPIERGLADCSRFQNKVLSRAARLEQARGASWCTALERALSLTTPMPGEFECHAALGRDMAHSCPLRSAAVPSRSAAGADLHLTGPDGPQPGPDVSPHSGDTQTPHRTEQQPRCTPAESEERQQDGPIEVEPEPEVGPLGRTAGDPVDQRADLVLDATVPSNLANAVHFLYPETGVTPRDTSPPFIDTMHPATSEKMLQVLPSGTAHTYAVELSVDEAGSPEQVSGDVVRVGGAAYQLHYRSDRVPGRVAGRSLSTDVRGQALGGWSLDVHHVYDTWGRVLRRREVTELTDAVGPAIRYVFDRSARALRAVPDDRDEDGSLMLGPGRPGQGFSYTPGDLLASYDPPAPAGVPDPTTTYAYNLERDITMVARPDGLEIGYQYDPAGRPTYINLPASYGVPAEAVSLAYVTTTGQVLVTHHSGGVGTSQAHDGFLVTGETVSGNTPAPIALSRGYDNDFRLASESVGGAFPVSFSYDADNLLTQAGVLASTRNPRNRVLSGTTIGTVTDVWTYNGFAEPSSYTARIAGADLYRSDYVRDNLGRITQKTATVEAVTTVYVYTYDAAGQLETVSNDGTQVVAYGYDSNGNRTDTFASFPAPETASVTYDDQGRLLTYGDTTFTYTANGELRSKTEGGQSTTYTYDVLGNLRIVELPDGTRLDYLVDGRGRRVGKNGKGALVQGFAQATEFPAAAELDGSGSIVARLAYGTLLEAPKHSPGRFGAEGKFHPESRGVTVAIGLDYAETPAVQPLRFASADARRVASVFESLGFEASVLTDGEVDAASLLRVLEDEARSSRYGDTLVIYFAGHGISDRNGQSAIVLPGRPFPGILPLSVLEHALGGYLGDVLVVLDGCAKQLSELPPFPKPTAHRRGRLSVFSGASVGGTALESPSLGSGLFTRGLLEYLDHVSTNSRPNVGTTRVDFREMFVSAARATSYLARSRYQREQHPTVLRWMN
jgi:YD repeat-containing protein